MKRLGAAFGRLGCDRFTAVIAAVSALGAALVLARGAAFGVGLDYDSVNFVSVARNLLAGEGFAQFDGNPYRVWPPLFPILLAAGGLAGFDPVDFAAPLNAALFGMIAFAVGEYLRRRLQSRFLAVWACAAAAVLPVMANLASFALSETAFMLLTVLGLIWADKALRDGKASSLAASAALCGLAWLTRYIGAVAVAAVAAALLIQPGAPPFGRAKRAAVFALIAGAPMAVWLARNYFVVGAFIENRRPVAYEASIVAMKTLRAFELFLYGEAYLYGDPPTVWAAVLAPLGALAAVAALAAVGSAFVREHRAKRRAVSEWRPFYLFGGYAAAYLALFFPSLPLGFVHSGVSARYLLPACAALLIAVCAGLDRFFVGERGKAARRVSASAIVIAALSLWVAGQAALNVRHVVRHNTEDGRRGYSGPPYADWETVRYVRDNPMDGTAYSNETMAVYLYNGGSAANRALPQSLPPANERWDADAGTGREQVERWVRDAPDGAFAVWFERSPRNAFYEYGSAELRETPGVNTVARLSDGEVFRLDKWEHTRRRSPAAHRFAESGEYGEPAARGEFDVYLAGGAAIYIRKRCEAEADTAARFFLHVFPADVNDLPEDRRRHGFANMDFDFDKRGAVLDGGVCAAIADLPEYEIVRIKTGQFVSGEAPLWSAEAAVSGDGG